MARAPDPRIDQAKAMYLKGQKLIEIANQLGLPEGTVRRWKCTHKWDNERSDSKANVRKSQESKRNRKIKQKEAVAEAVDQVVGNPDLTDQQRLFCLLYARTLNATRAYMEAYQCSYNTANAHAYKLMSNEVVRSEVQRLKKERFEAQIFDEHDIFQWYLDIASASVTDFVTFGREEVQVMGAFGPVEDKETGEPVVREVNYVKFRESDAVNGHVIKKVKLGKDGATIELYDAMAAMDWLSKHMTMGTTTQQTLAQTIMGAYQKQQEGAGDGTDRDG